MSQPIRPRIHRALALTSTFLAAMLFLGCTQLPSTADSALTATAEIGVDRGGATSIPVAAPIEVIPVWIQENAILPWKSQVMAVGVYQFEVENRGQKNHDLTIVRWPGNPLSMPSRSDRVQMQSVDIVARTSRLVPRQIETLTADLSVGGQYVLISGEGTDYGLGLVATFQVGSGAARPVPAPLPDPSDDALVGVYLVDGAVFLSRPDIRAGEVTLNVQNLGPSSHDLVVVRWRGEPYTLPTDDATGEVTLDVLTTVATMPPIEAGESATVTFEAENEIGYALISSLPGDYVAGMGARITVD